MQKEQIDRFVTLAGLEMPALISPGKFQEAEIYEDSAVLTFLLPKVYPLEELIDELEDQMELILLYHYLPSTSTDFGQKCCAYSIHVSAGCISSMPRQTETLNVIPCM